MNRPRKSLSIQQLKAGLSAAIAAAESGQTIEVTRHNAPVAHLGPATASHVHRGPRAGGPRLIPAMKRGTNGRSLAVLLEDRGNR